MPFPAAGDFPTGLVLRGLVAALLKEAASFAQVAAGETTTSTSFTNLATAGPAVTLTSVFDRALIMWSASEYNNTAGQASRAAIQISGATTLAAAVANGSLEAGGNVTAIDHMHFMIATITPGSNTYTMKYSVTGGTGLFDRRRLYVIAP